MHPFRLAKIRQVLFYAKLDTFVLKCKFNSKSLTPFLFENSWLCHCVQFCMDSVFYSSQTKTWKIGRLPTFSFIPGDQHYQTVCGNFMLANSISDFFHSKMTMVLCCVGVV